LFTDTGLSIGALKRQAAIMRLPWQAKLELIGTGRVSR
jgi:hypothetical protein